MFLLRILFKGFSIIKTSLLPYAFACAAWALAIHWAGFYIKYALAGIAGLLIIDFLGASFYNWYMSTRSIVNDVRVGPQEKYQCMECGLPFVGEIVAKPGTQVYCHPCFIKRAGWTMPQKEIDHQENETMNKIRNEKLERNAATMKEYLDERDKLEVLKDLLEEKARLENEKHKS